MRPAAETLVCGIEWSRGRKRMSGRAMVFDLDVSNTSRRSNGLPRELL
jgi:hypothetical protein